MVKSAVNEKEKKTLRFQIIMAVTVLVAFVAIVSGGYTAYSSYKSAVGSLSKSMVATVQQASQTASKEIGRFSALAQEIALEDVLYSETATPEEKLAYLDTKQNSELAGINYYSADGICLADGKDSASSDFFKAGISGETFIASPQTDEATGEFVLPISTPVWKNGVPGSSVIGVVTFLVKQQILNNIVENIKVSENGAAYIINNIGTTIAHSTIEKALTGDNIGNAAKTNSSLKALADVQSKAMNGETGFGKYTYNGVKKFVTYAPIEGTNGWSICVSAPEADFTHRVTTSIYVSCILIVFSILIGLLIATVMTKSLETALGGVIKRLTAFAEGDILSVMPHIEANSYESVTLKNTASLMIDNTGAIIKDLDYLLTEMSHGNFDITSAVPEKYIGDYENILVALKRMKSGLTDSFTNILQVAEQVSAGSSQVSSGAQTLAQGATEQASSIQELSASITEVSQRIKQNASDAEKAKELSSQAEQIMQGSVEDMELARQAMEEISATSKNISKVIKAIDDIAFQTNILALNAAVEAARAGAAGKGFAVVADEVRNLSQKSAEAAKNTTSLIESSIEAVEKGTNLVNRTSAGFTEVAIKSAEVGNIVDTIAVQAQEQSVAVSQIVVGIDQVSSVVQMNSATSEESAAASEELSSQAAVLKNIMEQFKLPEQ